MTIGEVLIAIFVVGLVIGGAALWVVGWRISMIINEIQDARRRKKHRRQSPASISTLQEFYEKYPHIYGKMVNDQFYPQAPVPVRRRRNQTW